MVVNETIEVINATTTVGAEPFGMSTILHRFLELVTAPYHHKNMIWIVLPLFIGLLLMQLYFGRYRKEELGWNTAVANSTALVFVSVDLVRQIYLSAAPTNVIAFIFENLLHLLVVLVIALWGAWLMFGEFFHLLPKKLAFFISSSLPTAIISYVAIVVIYTKLPIDFATFLAAILLLIVLAMLFWIIRMLEPAAKEHGFR